MTIASILNIIPVSEGPGKRSTPPSKSHPSDSEDAHDVEDGTDSTTSGNNKHKIRSRAKGRNSPTNNHEEVSDKLPLLRSDSFGSDESSDSTTSSGSSAGKSPCLLGWAKLLLLATIFTHILYNCGGLGLEIAYFPAHGYMLPRGLQPITTVPSLEYQRKEGVQPLVHIPRIVHVTYKSREQLPPEWQYSIEQWEKVHPDWEVRFWSDEDIFKFVHEQYPELEELHQSYKYMIQRVDSVRYMILHHFGGVYSDMDIYPATALDKLLQQWEDAGKSVLLAETSNMGVTNAFMASAPQSDFMKCLLDNLADYQHKFHHMIHWQHWEILSSAGSTFLWGMVGHCSEQRHQVQVLDAESFRGCNVCKTQGETCDTQWFHHSSTNSSWHVHTKWTHTLMFFVAYSYLCHPFRACFFTVTILLILARKRKSLKRAIVTTK
jgi:mannosyltransferase OCH1-like enzyme